MLGHEAHLQENEQCVHTARAAKSKHGTRRMAKRHALGGMRHYWHFNATNNA